ncbi:DUF4136 domain-containing protein [Thalassotalea euphylliae]|uniref:DUF4136 domain-containing protein n=1 Tax=Thalassotalea euphylliae TaxID=1655234 RepID=UPI00362CB97E
MTGTLRANIFIALTLLIVGCSSPKQADVKYQPIFDFGNLESYGLYGREDEFNDWQPLSHAIRNSIELAIEQEMEAQQFSFKPADSADVVITYYIVKQNQRTFRAYNQGVNYCSYCLTNTKSGKKEERLRIVPGSLIIDAVKPKNRRSIWRAAYPLRIKEKDNSAQINEKVKEAVSIIIKQFAEAANKTDSLSNRA